LLISESSGYIQNFWDGLCKSCTFIFFPWLNWQYYQLYIKKKQNQKPQKATHIVGEATQYHETPLKSCKFQINKTRGGAAFSFPSASDSYLQAFFTNMRKVFLKEQKKFEIITESPHVGI